MLPNQFRVDFRVTSDRLPSAAGYRKRIGSYSEVHRKYRFPRVPRSSSSSVNYQFKQTSTFVTAHKWQGVEATRQRTNVSALVDQNKVHRRISLAPCVATNQLPTTTSTGDVPACCSHAMLSVATVQRIGKGMLH
jgi:hypothetical protein